VQRLTDRFRAVAFAGMATMQVGVLLTANYGFFNYLTLALLLFVLDDRQLGRTPTDPPPPRRSAPPAPGASTW
jgi:hypothetical protein